MEKELTLRQIVNMFDGIKNFGSSGISIKGMGMFDLAINKAKIEPIVIKFDEERQQPEEIKRYNVKITMCKNNDDRIKLFNEYEQKIIDFDKKIKELNEKLNGKIKIDLIIIKKSDLIIDEKNGNAAETIFNLLPCIDVDK
jgi:hypothetical protein